MLAVLSDIAQCKITRPSKQMFYDYAEDLFINHVQIINIVNHRVNMKNVRK